MGLLDFIKRLVAGERGAEFLAENETATPALFEKCIAALVSEPQEFISISCDEYGGLVQISNDGDMIGLNIADYPSTDFPDELGIVLPEGSTLVDWEAESFARYSVPASESEALASAIDSIFRKLYNSSGSYKVSVTIER